MTASQADLIEILSNVPPEQIEAMIENLADGAKTPGEMMGVSADSLNEIERIAVNLYRTGYYDKSLHVFTYMLQLDPKRSSAYRGIGACLQGLKFLTLACHYYETAWILDPTDIVAQVLFGEGVCMLEGGKEAGIRVLKNVVEQGTDNPVYAPYITRARAILNANGDIPPRLVLIDEAAKKIRAATENDDLDLDPDEVDASLQPPSAEEIALVPELQENIAAIKKSLQEGSLTLAEVAGFTKEELEGGYFVVTQLLRNREPMKALLVVGTLIAMDPHNAKFYQGAGIALQQMKDYVGAAFLFQTAHAYDKTDAMTLIYWGECQLMQGRIDDGLKKVQQGQLVADKHPDKTTLIARAQALQKMFGSKKA